MRGRPDEPAGPLVAVLLDARRLCAAQPFAAGWARRISRSAPFLGVLTTDCLEQMRLTDRAATIFQRLQGGMADDIRDRTTSEGIVAVPE
jgi:hypothetical protein